MARTLHAEGQLGLFHPTSEWEPYTGPLPLLQNVDVAIDTETKDEGLAAERGPGWVGRQGYLCGVSVAWDDPRAVGGIRGIYLPVRHPDSVCRPLEEVLAWVVHLLTHCNCHFFNIGYDMGWLITEALHSRMNMPWPERSEDGGAMCFLADENYRSYGLDACCGRAGIPGKDETLLNEAAASIGVMRKNGSIKHGIFRMPAKYVGPYAEADAISTLRLCRTIKPVLIQEETLGAYRTEMELFPVTQDMRRRGIRVSTSKAEASQRKISLMAEEVLGTIDNPWRRKCTIDDLRSPRMLAQLFDAENIPYPLTPKTKEPSFTADWLGQLNHPLGYKVRRSRQLVDLADKFLGNYILGFEHRGRIHAEIRQLGPVTNRFAYANPPMQQMPSRDGELAPLIRDPFEPEEGEKWLAADFKGQEPRLNIHFAYLAKKEAAKHGIKMGDIDNTVEYYRTDPNPDFHTLGASMLGLSRKDAKDLNQGLSYRMGAAKLAITLHCSEELAEERWNLYHEKIPYISGIAKYAEVMARSRGYVRMIDGARRHFSLWQPKYNREGEDSSAFRADAEKRWPNQVLERAFVYQAGNGVVQGSAARQMKRAMVAVYKAGYRSLITMHDELGNSVTSAKQCREIGEIMCQAVKLVIPVTVDLEVGPTWGKAKTHYTEIFKEAA